MKNFLSKLFDFICFVCGPSWIVYNLLYIFLEKGKGHMKYEPDVSGFLDVSVGVALVCLGFLVKHWKKTAGK